MTECCKPNKLQVSGEDEFEELHLVVCDSERDPQAGWTNLGEEDEVLDAVKDCVEEKGGFANGTSREYISSWRVRGDAAAAASSMIGIGMGSATSLLGVGVWGLGVVGLNLNSEEVIYVLGKLFGAPDCVLFVYWYVFYYAMEP
ncbi:hypothetical protein SMAC4_13423 [Sordaria macrospora]|uniref:uncharacterized protein n=1 Tax=Sordaria macrospora TaxID=5147 RepID=UPI002B320BB9|nr:hypothetical protein SMAC4_13423 [Sordaria macrospora]